MKKYYLILFLLLAGCAQLPPKKQLEPLWKVHQTVVKPLEQWILQGRIVISNEREAWNAQIIWQQHAKHYRLVFNSPMGQGAMRLEGNDHQAVLFTADNRTLVASDPEALIADVMDVEIPVMNLHYWIRGLPAQDDPLVSYQLNAQGYLSALQQANWKVDFKRYIDIEGIDLPDKIFMKNRDYEVRIVISSWEINQTHLKQVLENKETIQKISFQF